MGAQYLGPRGSRRAEGFLPFGRTCQSDDAAVPQVVPLRHTRAIGRLEMRARRETSAFGAELAAQEGAGAAPRPRHGPARRAAARPLRRAPHASSLTDLGVSTFPPATPASPGYPARQIVLHPATCDLQRRQESPTKAAVRGSTPWKSGKSSNDP